MQMPSPKIYLHGIKRCMKPCSADQNKLMKRALLRYFLLVAVAALFPVLVSQFYFEFRVRPRIILFQKMQEILDPRNEPEVVILSDSIGFDGIVRSSLPRNFSDMTIGGSNLRLQYAILSALLRKKKSIRYVVISLGDYVLGDERAADDSGISGLVSYATKQELAEVFSFTEVQYLRAWLNHFLFIFDSIQPANFWGSLRGDLLALMGHRPPRETFLDECLNNSRGPHIDWENRTREDQLKIMDFHYRTKLSGQLVVPGMVSALDHMIELTKAHGARLIGVDFPTLRDWDIFQAKYDFEQPRRVFREKLDTILDYRDLFRDQPHMFSYDQWHLSQEGSLLFTRRFVEDIQSRFGIRVEQPIGCNVASTRGGLQLRWPYVEFLSR
jgi:hypothetical protein